MTTQREVAAAFFNFETGPRRASNFRMETVGDGGLRAFLIGGDDAVYAERQPIDQFTIYEDWRYHGWYTDGLASYAVQDQHMLVRRAARHEVPDHIDVEVRGNGVSRDERIVPTTDDFDDLQA